LAFLVAVGLGHPHSACWGEVLYTRLYWLTFGLGPSFMLLGLYACLLFAFSIFACSVLLLSAQGQKQGPARGGDGAGGGGGGGNRWWLVVGGGRRGENLSDLGFLGRRWVTRAWCAEM
jgi:hypothetical protein